MARVPIFRSSLPVAAVRTAPVAPKTADAIYHSAEYAHWREAVIARAGGQCEALVDGRRCRKAAPRFRMFADHKVELRDGGAPFDPDNGRCLCGAHHSAKTAAARARRHGLA